MQLGPTPRAGQTQFALWSTSAETARVELYDPSDPHGKALSTHGMDAHGKGIFSCVLEGVGNGALYKFSINGRALPDPYARFPPFGVDGPAMVVEPRYEWCAAPRPAPRNGEVI